VAVRFPEFDELSCLVKVIVLNTLYGTNVWAVQAMAKHVSLTLNRLDLKSAEPELVERLAELPQGNLRKVRRHRSFASKFAHFYIDARRFPILDQYAESMVRFHIGPASGGAGPVASYVEYAARFRELAQATKWTGSTNELDAYLWLAGEYRAWLRNQDVSINAELKNFLNNPPPAARSSLQVLRSALCV